VKVGLIWAKEQGANSIAVSPCDVPMLPPDLFPKLLGAASGGAAMAQTDEGHQPQCAVWPVSALPQLREALANGQHPATWMMLQKIGAQRVRFPNAQDFMNINTRIDLAMLANRLELQAATAAGAPPDDGTPRYQR
jgi:molybdopterin-guanine dinucleotide biosynthesis protein A